MPGSASRRVRSRYTRARSAIGSWRTTLPIHSSPIPPPAAPRSVWPRMRRDARLCITASSISLYPCSIGHWKLAYHSPHPLITHTATSSTEIGLAADEEGCPALHHGEFDLVIPVLDRPLEAGVPLSPSTHHPYRHQQHRDRSGRG